MLSQNGLFFNIFHCILLNYYFIINSRNLGSLHFKLISFLLHIQLNKFHLVFFWHTLPMLIFPFSLSPFLHKKYDVLLNFTHHIVHPQFFTKLESRAQTYIVPMVVSVAIDVAFIHITIIEVCFPCMANIAL